MISSCSFNAWACQDIIFLLVLQDKFGNYKNKKFCFRQLSDSVWWQNTEPL